MSRVDALDRIAEARLREAVASGALETPLAGQPLALDDDAGVPPELRLAWRALKSAGYLPEELVCRRELLRLQDLLAACDDEGRRRTLQAERAVHALRYELLMERRGWTAAALAYRDRLPAAGR